MKQVKCFNENCSEPAKYCIGVAKKRKPYCLEHFLKARVNQRKKKEDHDEKMYHLQ